MPKRPPGVYVNGILGQLLRELDKLGTVKETAPLVGMTPEHLSYIRTGRVKRVPLRDIERIANAVGFTLKFERKSDALPPNV